MQCQGYFLKIALGTRVVYPMSGMSYTGLSLHKNWDVAFILAVARNIKHKGF